MTLIQVGEGLPRHSGGDPLAARGIGPGVVYLGLFLGCVAIVVAVINGYVVIRRMLKRSLPRNVRTRGPVAILRAIGTLLCVLIVTALVLPMVVFGACLLYAVD
jgi:fructose-specific phosphotransferase system IIC component